MIVHKVKLVANAVVIMKTCPCNIKRFFQFLKIENFIGKSFDIFNAFAQNSDCGYMLESPRRGSSNEYPQSMFWIRNMKNIVYPCIPQFYYVKVRF